MMKKKFIVFKLLSDIQERSFRMKKIDFISIFSKLQTLYPEKVINCCLNKNI